MRKNEIKKKNISANALSNDDLETVAGGWCSAGNGEYRLSSGEISKLKAAGFKVSMSDSVYPSLYPKYVVRDERGYNASTRELWEILGPDRYRKF